MSHHFDCERVRQDGRLDLCDVYVFGGRDPNTTVMIMTVNPMAGDASPTTFSPDACYDFKIDLDGDASEDVSFRFAFSEPADDERQDFTVQRIDHRLERTEQFASGRTGEAAPLPDGGMVWAGLCVEPFHFTSGYFEFSQALLDDGRFDLQLLSPPDSFFKGKNVTGIVLQVPTAVLGAGSFGLWCTTGVLHASRVEPVNRHAIPILQIILQRHPTLGNAYNTTGPDRDRGNYWQHVASTVEQACRVGGRSKNPSAQGRALADRFLPNVLVYDSTSPAVFSASEVNGRPLEDDAMGAFWSAVTQREVRDSIVRDGYRSEFPFLLEVVAEGKDRRQAG
jgi:hypothetical protein